LERKGREQKKKEWKLCTKEKKTEKTKKIHFPTG
jgi:hypothetical protein